MKKIELLIYLMCIKLKKKDEKGFYEYFKKGYSLSDRNLINNSYI